MVFGGNVGYLGFVDGCGSGVVQFFGFYVVHSLLEIEVVVHSLLEIEVVVAAVIQASYEFVGEFACAAVRK